jgi:hypothetical protein
LHIENIEVLSTNQKITEINIYCKAKFDEEAHTPMLSRALAEAPYGLISINEVKLDLEEIFKRMTNVKGQ